MKKILPAAGVLLGAVTLANAQGHGAHVADVLIHESSGWCGGWVARMPEAGFTVNVQNVSGDTLNAAKEASGLPGDLWACHTASVSGYTVEGHVPVSEITRLLNERPAALGIATPGMPTGSPGMENGDELEAYDVMLVNLDGGAEVYASYPGS